MNSLLLCLGIGLVKSLDCSTLSLQTIEFDVYSGTDDWVVGNLNPNGDYGAVMMNNYSRNADPNGLFIWESAYPYDSLQKLTSYVGKQFNIPGTPTWAQIKVVAYDQASVKINNQDAQCSTTSANTLKTCTITSYVISGLNKVNITVISSGVYASIAGVNYKITIRTSVKDIEQAP